MSRKPSRPPPEVSLREHQQDKVDWQRTFDAVPHAIFVLDSENRIQRANRAAAETVRCELSQMLGQHCYEVIHKTDAPPARCPHSTLLQNLHGGRGELVEPRLDKIFETTCNPVRDEQGTLLGSVQILSDITARKRAEEKHARLVAVLEETSDLVGLANPNGEVTYINKNGRSMVGLGESEDLSGKVMSDFLSAFGALVTLGTGIPTATRDGVWTGESELLSRDGQIRPISQVIVAHKEPDGTVQHFSTIARDISESRRAEEYVRTQLSRVEALHSIDIAINASLDIQVALSIFLDHVTRQLGVDAADILLLNPHSQMLEYTAGRGFRFAPAGTVHTHLRESPAGAAILGRRITVIPDLKPILGNFHRAASMAKEGFVSYAAAPLIAKGAVCGVLEIWHRQQIDGDSEWLDFLGILAGQGAIAISNAELTQELQSSNAALVLAYDSTLEGWVHALDMRDHETEGHTRRVTDLTVRLAYAYPVNNNEVIHIRRGALLHDIGKMAVPDAILHKPGPLTEEEMEIMKRHPAHAHEWLSPIPYLRPALNIPYCHHEKWDGSGYPRGLKGEEIPLHARMFSIVDVWDALRSNRPYRASWSKEKVAAYIKERSGTDFDPQVVAVFMKHVKEYA